MVSMWSRSASASVPSGVYGLMPSALLQTIERRTTGARPLGLSGMAASLDAAHDLRAGGEYPANTCPASA